MIAVVMSNRLKLIENVVFVMELVVVVVVSVWGRRRTKRRSRNY